MCFRAAEAAAESSDERQARLDADSAKAALARSNQTPEKRREVLGVKKSRAQLERCESVVSIFIYGCGSNSLDIGYVSGPKRRRVLLQALHCRCSLKISPGSCLLV